MNTQSYAMSHLPERFQTGPRTQTLHNYIQRKYNAYGYRHHTIEYNPEFQAEGTCDRYRWVEHVSEGLRKVGDAHDVIRLRHTGYFIDNFQDETVHGEVWQLPARNGETIFVPAVNDPYNRDCSCVDFSSITSDKEDAARWADSMAESWAEREREYQAKEDARIRLEKIDKEIKTEYWEFRRIAREIRANCDALQGIAVVRELVRDKWRDTKDTIHKLRAQARRIEERGIEY